METLYANNYPPMYRKLESEINSWSKNLISWLGRENSIKMTLLPRLLYLLEGTILNPSKVNCWNPPGERWAIESLNGLYMHIKERGVWAFPIYLYKYYQAARLAQLSIVYSRFEKPDMGSNRKTSSFMFHSRLPAVEPPEEQTPNFSSYHVPLFCPLGLPAFIISSSINL